MGRGGEKGSKELVLELCVKPRGYGVGWEEERMGSGLTP